MNVLVVLLVLLGIGMVFYFMFCFDVSVEAPGSEALGIAGGRVNNIGLMADRQNGLIFGFGILILAAILHIGRILREKK